MLCAGWAAWRMVPLEFWCLRRTGDRPPTVRSPTLGASESGPCNRISHFSQRSRWVVARMNGERFVLSHTASGKPRLRSECITESDRRSGLPRRHHCYQMVKHTNACWTEDHLNSCMLRPVREFNHVDPAGAEQVIPMFHFHGRIVVRRP